jgi:putative transposase
MSLAVFIADQRASHQVSHAVACRALAVSESWFYKWHHRSRHPAPSEQRRAELDAEAFEAARGLYGSPRILVDLRAAGWTVSEKSVAKSMARQGLVARPDKRAAPFPDLMQRDFTAPASNIKWVGDMTEIPTDEGKLYLSTAIDLFSRRLLGYATSSHSDAELAGETVRMTVAARGGKDRVAGVIFHSDRGSTYTAHDFTVLCDKLGIRHSAVDGPDRVVFRGESAAGVSPAADLRTRRDSLPSPGSHRRTSGHRAVLPVSEHRRERRGYLG